MDVKKANVPMADPGEIARWVEIAEESGEADNYGGKRQAIRFSEGMRLEVATDPAQASCRWNVVMHNVSDNGFAFWSKREVPARTSIHVRDASDEKEGRWLTAWVRHCTRGIRGFLVGAAFGGNPNK